MYLKPTGVSQTLRPNFCGNLVDHFGDGKGFRDVAREVARARKMPEENRENLVRRDERAVGIHRADAVRVAIEREPRVVAARAHRLAQGLDVRLDRLRIHAAEKRIALAADFSGLDSVAAKQLAQQASSRSVHRINQEAELRSSQTVPIHETGERLEIWSAHVERMNQIIARRKRGNSVAQDSREFLLHLRNDGGRRRTSVTRLQFHSVPAIRIVARRDLDSAGGASLPHEQGNRGRRTRLGRKPDGRAGGSDRFGSDARETLGGKPRVVADDDARARFLGANHVARDRVRDRADVFVREILGDDAAPAVGAELYREVGRARFVSIRHGRQSLFSMS